MAYRPAPIQIAKYVSNQLKGKLLKRAPVWLPAVQAIPPGPSIIRSQNPHVNVSGQTEIEKELFETKRVMKTQRYSQKHLRTPPPRPRAIVYPEDKLRRKFYKEHPFELARPKTLVENDLGTNRTDFSKLLLDGMHLSEVDGEAVIKYQLHLMTHERLPERKAYAQATSEFYKIRAQQEDKERKAKEKMVKVLNANPKKWTDRGIYLEERALRAGQEADANF
ncbi:mitochondrial ribosomal protein S25 [Sporodiniella umbellata]|nr:mitochondrial ribosomal protein S25 [Sporodiniella umbellata]